MDDQSLLARFVRTKDANAFEELTRRHAGMVKAVCVRILGNAHDAEEVTQECFLELARSADCVRSSVVGWLHRAATSRSLNLLRSKSRRRVRERAVGAEANVSQISSDISTRELHRVINGAMTELPEDLRLPVKLHYFEGQSQRDVAKTLGVNQSTISRRMQEALLFLRDRLTRAGFATTSPAVVFLLQNPKVLAADEIGVSGMTVPDSAIKSVGAGAGSTIYTCLKSVVVAIVPILFYLLIGGWLSFAVAIGLTICVARSRPNWLAELYASVGFSDLYTQPMFSLTKWTWTTPPNGWRTQVMVSIASSVFFGSLAVLFAAGTARPQMGTAVLGLMAAVWFAIHALRIIYRVCFVCTSNQCSDSPSTHEETILSSDPRDLSVNLFDLVQLLVIGTAGVIFTFQSIVVGLSSFEWPAIFLVGSVGFGMMISGLWLFCRLMRLNELNLRVMQNATVSLVRRVVLTPRFAFTTYTHFVRHDGNLTGTQNPPNQVNREFDRADCHNPANKIATRRWTGTHRLLVMCSSIICVLSMFVVWNPTAVKGMSLSLAAIQTSMLGWIVYRLAAFRRSEDPGIVRFATIVVVVACFVLNSGVCFANWLG